ncbi:MAG: hypothetical protein IJJ44_03355 [Solobacterium sp.]|nr:hypothetical protein [Solobacterium sp.]
MKGRTNKGFEFEVKDNAVDDMRLIEAMSEIDRNPLAFTKVCRLLLGDEQKERLYQFLEREDGTVPVKDVSETVTEIINLLGEEGKNS